MTPETEYHQPEFWQQYLPSRMQAEITISLTGQIKLAVPLEFCLELLTLLKKDNSLALDHLATITAADQGESEGVIILHYHLQSYLQNFWLHITTSLPRQEPVTGSVHHLWPAANWAEREVFDMFGIQFTNHPDMRRILMPSDWEGHPLRKDYVNPAYYQGLPTGFDESRQMVKNLTQQGTQAPANLPENEFRPESGI